MNWRTLVEVLARRKRDEAGSLAPAETTLPPLHLQTANGNIFRGVDPHQRKDPEKENNRRTWGRGGGGATRSKGKAEMVLSVSRQTSES